MQSPFLLGAAIVAAAIPFASGESPVADDAFLAPLRSEAERNHPSVAAARLKARAAGRDVGAVRLWDDPMLGVMFMGGDRMMREEEGDISIGVEQALPQPGLYQATRAKADSMRRAEVANSRTSLLRTGATTAKDAIELALVDESIRLQQAQLGWLREMGRNAAERAVDPAMTSVDALRLDSELAREVENLEAAKRNREGLAQRLNLNLGRPLDRPWPELRLPAVPPPVPLANAEVARVRRVNPEVLAMREMANAAGAETRIAGRERAPKFAVGVQSNLYSGGDYRSTEVGVRMTLPWFNEPSYRAREDAARLREQAASADVETMIRKISADVINLATEAANASAQARAYAGDVYNRSEEAVRTIEASWITSNATLNSLLEANRLLFSIRLEQRRFIAMQLAALEELNVLVPR